MTKRPLASLLLSLSLAVLMSTACDGETDEDLVGDGDGDIGDGDGDGDGDLPGDGDGDVGDGDGDSCTDNQELCDGTCTATSADPAHCGECNNECDEDQGCVLGVCEDQGCGEGLISCDDTCIDPLQNEAYCGGCDNSCTTGQVCVNGGCLDECPEGFLECGDLCFDPLTDDERCGATACEDLGGGGAGGAPADGLVCTGEEVCQIGVCTVTCDEPGEVACGDSCIDPQTDNTYCGATTCADDATDGEACTGGLLCLEGTCRDQVWAWSTPEVISTGAVRFADMKTDGSGNVWAVYGGDTLVHARRYDHATRTWSDTVHDLDVGRYYGPFLAVAKNGDAIAVGVKLIQDQVEYSVNAAFYSAASGTWGAPVRIDDASVVAVKREVSVVLDEAGDAIVTWDEGPWVGADNDVDAAALMVRHYTGGVWGAVTPVTGYPGAGTAQRFPELVVNASGDVVHVWQDTLTNLFSGGYRPFARVWDKNAGTWTAPDALASAANQPMLGALGSVQGGIDSVGNAYAVWAEWNGTTGNAFMSSLSAGTQDWSEGVSVETTADFMRTLELVTQPDGTSHMSMGNTEVYTSEVSSNLTFSMSDLGAAPGSTNASPSSPKIAVDTFGQVHAAWLADNNVTAALREAGVWGAAVPLNDPTTRARGLLLADGLSGRMYLTFIRGGEMYYSRYD